MLTVRGLPAVGMGAVVVLLGSLQVRVGLSPAAWGVGLLCGAAVGSFVVLGLRRAGSVGPGPADVVTGARAVITCALAALATDALLHGRTTGWFVPMAVLALLLDAVDGGVARRTRSCSAFGGRFDGEADAFLILVLSIDVAPRVGAWVVSAGLVRYAFAVAGWVLPWMGAPLPFRYWRKVVTATVGIVLAAAAADLHPRWLTTGAVALGLALLAESFGRDIGWLWIHRAAREPAEAQVSAPVRVPSLTPAERG